MFAKLVGKVKTVGQHDVGSLDMFLLSDSDSDDEAGGGYLRAEEKSPKKRKNSQKYQNHVRDKSVPFNSESSAISSKRKRNPNKLKLDRSRRPKRLSTSCLSTGSTVRRRPREKEGCC